MGAWGTEPWASDEAASWFSQFFAGIDVDQRLEAALQRGSADEARAAAHLLVVLGDPYVWPGLLENYNTHLDRAIDRLRSLTDPASPDSVLDLWGTGAASFEAAVARQIEQLQRRRLPEPPPA